MSSTSSTTTVTRSPACANTRTSSIPTEEAWLLVADALLAALEVELLPDEEHARLVRCFRLACLKAGRDAPVPTLPDNVRQLNVAGTC